MGPDSHGISRPGDDGQGWPAPSPVAQRDFSGPINHGHAEEPSVGPMRVQGLL